MDDMQISLNGFLGKILEKVICHAAKKHGVCINNVSIDRLVIKTNDDSCEVRVAASGVVSAATIEKLVNRYVIGKE